MIITANDFIQYLLGIEPEFKDDYGSYFKFMHGEANPHGIATALSDFVSKRLREDEYKNAKAVFAGIETLLTGNRADENIKNAICTCFLENLLNRFTEEHNILDRFIPVLGPESIKYCKAWDEFTRVKTHGLWGTEKPNFRSRFKLSDVEALEIIEAIKLREYKSEIEEDNKIRLLELAMPGISNLLFYDRRDLAPTQILEEAKSKNNAKPRKG